MIVMAVTGVVARAAGVGAHAWNRSWCPAPKATAYRFPEPPTRTSPMGRACRYQIQGPGSPQNREAATDQAGEVRSEPSLDPVLAREQVSHTMLIEGDVQNFPVRRYLVGNAPAARLQPKGDVVPLEPAA